MGVWNVVPIDRTFILVLNSIGIVGVFVVDDAKRTEQQTLIFYFFEFLVQKIDIRDILS